MTVYFIRAGEDGPIKVGHGKNPALRLSHMQVGHYEELAIIGTCSGGKEKEIEIHARHHAHHIRGEWFSATPELLMEIEVRHAEKRPRKDRYGSQHSPLGRYLKSRGMTMAAFGKLVGADASEVSRWISGRRTPSWTAIEKIAEVTDRAVLPNDFMSAPARAA